MRAPLCLSSKKFCPTSAESRSACDPSVYQSREKAVALIHAQTPLGEVGQGRDRSRKRVRVPLLPETGRESEKECDSYRGQVEDARESATLTGERSRKRERVSLLPETGLGSERECHSHRRKVGEARRSATLTGDRSGKRERECHSHRGQVEDARKVCPGELVWRSEVHVNSLGGSCGVCGASRGSRESGLGSFNRTASRIPGGGKQQISRAN